MGWVNTPATVVAVFVLTSYSLGISVQRDLAGAELDDVKEHVVAYIQNSSHTEDLAKDFNVALAAVFRSELSVFLCVQWFFSAYAMAALATIVLFLGQLTPRETSRLTERLVKFLIFKVVFCGALIIPDIYEIVLWLGWFAMVGYMRIFMGVARDRLDALSVSPSSTTSAHMRALALVVCILGHDLVGVAALINSLGAMSTTKALLCAFDMAVVAVDGFKALLHYGVHAWDQYLASRLADAADAAGADDDPNAATTGDGGGRGGGLGWESWEGKGALLYHTELVADVLVLTMTLAHYLHVWFLHGLSFQLIDAILFLDIRSIVMSMLKRIRGYLNYRTVTHSLRHAFPDAVPGPAHEQCTICMDRMVTAKQLPCGHMFHLACLRAWLQQSGAESFACPLCRTPLLQVRRGAPPPARVSPLLSAAAHAASVVYLDVVVLLLLGLPLSGAPSLRRAAAAAAARQAAAAAARGGAGGGDAHDRGGGGAHGYMLERVGESEHPGGAEGPGGGRGARGARGPAAWGRRLLDALLLLRGRRGAGAAAAGGGGAAVEEAVHSDDDTDIGEYDELGDDAEYEQARRGGGGGGGKAPARRRAEWGGQPPRAGGGGAGPSRAPGAVRGVYGGGAGPSRAPVPSASGASGGSDGTSGGGAGPSSVPPRYPPPYTRHAEPSTWSDASMRAASATLVATIRSSLGMGVRGRGGAVAGGAHPETDEEVESPYRRLAARRRSDNSNRAGGGGGGGAGGGAGALEAVPEGDAAVGGEAPSKMGSHKSTRLKKILSKAQNKNKPIPHWIRYRTDNKIRYNAKRRHWRRTKMGI
ncbi:hypothetical protein FOA52_014839 [Chlamydomonas sp. UWO 241]|nr:hypothetical protein FOA52_014839 [Chlamydomonas sp. UWO 241]